MDNKTFASGVFAAAGAGFAQKVYEINKHHPGLIESLANETRAVADAWNSLVGTSTRAICERNGVTDPKMQKTVHDVIEDANATKLLIQYFALVNLAVTLKLPEFKRAYNIKDD